MPVKTNRSTPREPLRVACVLFDRMSLFELGIAAEVFGSERPEVAPPLYRLRLAQAEPGRLRSRGGLELRAEGGLAVLRHADLVIVPGWRDVKERAPQPLLRALRAANDRGATVLSICSGAFVLADAGLLDGRSATTHWRYADVFRARFPSVDLRPDVLYVDEGSIVTSAGSAAGIDACLHIVRRNHGAAIANLVARTMVTPPQREGTQAQFVPQPVATGARQGMAPLLDWARQHLARPLRVADLARRAAMSERSFLRHFTHQVGLRPKAWLRRERVRAAQLLLEQSSRELEWVAEQAGFGSAQAMRVAFKSVLGTSPSQHRRIFRD